MAESELSAQVDAVTVLPSPSGLDASATTSEVNLSWSNNDDSSDGSIIVEKSTDGGSTFSDIASSLSPTTNTYTDSSVSQGEDYDYRVTRSTDHAEATSSTITATVELPAPSNISFTDTSTEDELTLSWDSVDGATKYNIYRAETSFSDKTNATNIDSVTDDGSTSYSYTDSGLEDGEKFYYSVTAAN